MSELLKPLHITSSSGGGSTTHDAYTVLIVHVPPIVGYWWPADGVCVSLPKVPNRFHQWMMKLVFGWKFTKVVQHTPKEQKKELLLG